MMITSEHHREIKSRLVYIKLLHTAIWIFFNFLMAYLVYAVVTNRIGKWVWISLGCFFLEGVVLLVFRNFCPLTLWARKYSDSAKDNFDIYLPNWLAKYNKLIYTSLLLLVIALLVYRLLAK